MMIGIMYDDDNYTMMIGIMYDDDNYRNYSN